MRGGRKRILVIDDDEDVRELARFSLEAQGIWDVSVAESGEAGLLIAESDPPDAILLDVMMPDMDGPTVLRHLRGSRRAASVPVVFLTGKAHAADAHRLRNLDVRALIAKPFDPFDLPRRVSEALGWSP